MANREARGVRLNPRRLRVQNGKHPGIPDRRRFIRPNPIGNIRPVAPGAGWARNRKPEIGLVNYQTSQRPVRVLSSAPGLSWAIRRSY